MVIGLLLTGYAGIINPASHPYLSLLGFAFPAFLFANMAFLVFWVMFRLRYAVVPFLGFVLAYSPVQTYFPLNMYHDAPEGSLKVLSYNVLGFKAEPDNPTRIQQYLLDSGADIICMQEFFRGYSNDPIWDAIDSVYHYSDTIKSMGFKHPGGDCLGILSKYPIVGKGHIPIHTAGNSLGIFLLDVDGDTVRVINAHLETVGMSQSEKEGFSSMVHGDKERDEVKRESKFLARKIAESSAIRAPQADAIERYLRKHSGKKVILCGDLNDHPLSYVHSTIARRLTDCYREAGHWAGYSFHYHSMYVRIDNIMCSEHWTPYECVVDNSIDTSDHYPIYCYLKSKNAEE